MVVVSLDLSNFYTSSVKNMNNIFEGCNNLISLDLSNFDTSSVENMNNMFYGCSSLVVHFSTCYLGFAFYFLANFVENFK